MVRYGFRQNGQVLEKNSGICLRTTQADCPENRPAILSHCDQTWDQVREGFQPSALHFDPAGADPGICPHLHRLDDTIREYSLALSVRLDHPGEREVQSANLSLTPNRTGIVHLLPPDFMLLDRTVLQDAARFRSSFAAPAKSA